MKERKKEEEKETREVIVLSSLMRLMSWLTYPKGWEACVSVESSEDDQTAGPGLPGGVVQASVMAVSCYDTLRCTKRERKKERGRGGGGWRGRWSTVGVLTPYLV